MIAAGDFSPSRAGCEICMALNIQKTYLLERLKITGTAIMHTQFQRVVVGVCTFRRPAMLSACLDSIAMQVLPADVEMHIVVVDNEERPNNQNGVEAFAAACPVPVHYVHQPKRGIAAARNAILDKAMELGAAWIAMLDDDETAAPDWIDQLMVMEYRHIPVLQGRRIGVYPHPLPFWAPENINRSSEQTSQWIEGRVAKHGSTNNVRFSVALIHAGLRFDESMGLASGSDQRFFKAALQSGFAIHVTKRAVTYETIHRERLTYRSILKREYAHTASTVATRVSERGFAGLAEDFHKRIVDVPFGLINLIISVPAAALGRRHFKKFARRGGKRLARVAGHLVFAVGHHPQLYRKVVGH